MTLDQYLRTSTDTAETLASRLGISAASVSRIRNGRQNISLALARRLSNETQGMVGLADIETVEAS